MMKPIKYLTAVVLGLTFALPVIGCRQNDNEKVNEKVLDVQVDTGKTKVKVEGSRKPDERARQLDVNVEHHVGHDQESGGRDK